MIPISLKLVNRPPSAAAIMKQMNFGIAKGLTETGKQAQAAVHGALKGAFTLRGNWFEQSNKFGIKVKPATPRDLVAEVRTNADWLEQHETGSDKVARGGGMTVSGIPDRNQSIAVPSKNVLRTKRMVISRREKPKGHMDAFVIQGKYGPILVRRFKRGARKGLTVLYGLERKLPIKKRSTFYEPIEKVLKRRRGKNIDEGIEWAFKNARW